VDTRDVLRALPAVAIAAVLTGCAYQDPFSLPPLGAPGVQQGPSTTLYYGHGPYPRYGYGYGYGYNYNPYTYYPYYYGSGYRYGSGYGAQPYPPTAYLPYPGGPYCRDANRDGRCDAQSSPPERNPQQGADVFERLRDRIETRAGAAPAVPPSKQGTFPGRPPPPPKVAPPKTSPAPAARTESEPARPPNRPGRTRSPDVTGVEP
jgi:hypothetical protein